MSFPLYIDLFGLRLHPHPLFEMIAYTAGFQLYLRTRHRWQHAPIPLEKNLWIVVACVFGALVGSHLLNIAEMPGDYLAHRTEFSYWLAGKTIVGGLIGGWAGVELAKRIVGVRYATGDAYVFPLIVGTAIGRIGCFLTGLEDATYGTPTALPWGVDFGDGIARHPTQLYEMLFVLAVGLYLRHRSRRPYANGYLFRFYMFAYFLFRFAVEFLKPHTDTYLGLSAIQIASLAAALFCARIFLPASAVGPAQPAGEGVPADRD
ncbi:MAG: prolipoprotein diacylglyceryl transferase [Bacteroidetes bacterium]|nr:prolipoprotein diacylglyceryl transferase [Bacteroidota bacterium]